tara:strand:- start:628 stop:1221 length:594 start_codon:yes stop_codon:yes gene_type:complete
MNKKFTEIYNFIDSEMNSAISDYKNPFHLFVIGNSSKNAPHMRTVVLRYFSTSKQILEFHSDIRSPKISQLETNPNFSALFYNPDKKVQLRFSGTVQILHKDASTKKRWRGISNSSRRCYLGPYNPSSAIKENHPNIPDEFRFGDPKLEQTEEGFKNFVIVRCQFSSIDYLSLKYSGHSRCRFDFQGKNVSVCWLAP